MSYLETKNSYINVNGQKIAYRELGKKNSNIPLVMLVHLAATLDNWDPKLLDLISKENHVIVLDLPGVGASEGKVVDTIQGMALQTIEIIETLGYSNINLLGLSMGGMIAQEVVREKSSLINKLILAGTGPRGGIGLDKVTIKTFRFMFKAFLHKVDPKRYIFYNHDEQGGLEANKVLTRMNSRDNKYKDKSMKVLGFLVQLRAIKKWGKAEEDNLSFIKQPTLIVNGDNDMQVPTENSLVMHKKIVNSKLIIYKNSGHGSIFQKAEGFSQELNKFLA